MAQDRNPSQAQGWPKEACLDPAPSDSACAAQDQGQARGQDLGQDLGPARGMDQGNETQQGQGQGQEQGQRQGAEVIRRQFRSGDIATRAALADVTGRLAAFGLSEDDLGSIELALAEALNNVTEHAYGPEGGIIELLVELDQTTVLCELRDQGRPMPRREAPSTSLPLIAPPDHLPEGGFGWHIIRCLVSDLGYRHDETGNSLTFTLPLSAEIDG